MKSPLVRDYAGGRAPWLHLAAPRSSRRRRRRWPGPGPKAAAPTRAGTGSDPLAEMGIPGARPETYQTFKL